MRLVYNLHLELGLTFFLFSAPRLLRPFRVRREGDAGHFGAPLHDRVPHDHQGEPPAHGKHSTHK